jgi:hypothetical protein
MCSSPKGVSAKARPSSKVESLFDGMNAAEYSDFVQQANESYELRQHELAVLRASRYNRVSDIRGYETTGVSSRPVLYELITGFIRKYIYS